jgi:dihydroorotate dehydrogenase
VKECVKVPVFIKLSPNSTINEKIAEHVKKAGGAGVSATNTMYSLMDPDPNMDPYPAVGKNKHTYYGGAAGSVLRPIALRVASTIANNPLLKGMNIMATGGIINAQHALAYTMFGGASVYQICSAVQEQDFSIINDLSTGLRALLYLSQRKDLIKNGWKGQSPPVLKMQKLKRYLNEFDLTSATDKRTDVNISRVPRIEDMKGKGN